MHIVYAMRWLLFVIAVCTWEGGGGRQDSSCNETPSPRRPAPPATLQLNGTPPLGSGWARRHRLVGFCITGGPCPHSALQNVLNQVTWLSYHST